MIRLHITKKILHDSYNDLTNHAKLDFDFLLFTVASASICALGFKMNSASVIIGAMVISPLLYPVICVGTATWHMDWAGFIRAVSTFTTGFFSTIAAAVTINLAYKTTFQSELFDRLSAGAVDYFLVAFFQDWPGLTRSFRLKFTKPFLASPFLSP